jgi:hypothetical protein
MLKLKSMTQSEINKFFLTDIGQNLESVFVTSDDRVFVRFSEAYRHTIGKLDPNTEPLSDQRIFEWCYNLDTDHPMCWELYNVEEA